MLPRKLIKKYLKKGIYLENKERKLLMVWDYNDSTIIEYQTIINLLDNTPNRKSKFRPKIGLK